MASWSSGDSTPAPGAPTSDDPVTSQPWRTRSRQSHWPANPPAPVTSARRAATLLRGSRLDVRGHVRIHHHADEFAERHLRLPAEVVLRLRRIGDEKFDFRRPDELGRMAHMRLVVEA